MKIKSAEFVRAAHRPEDFARDGRAQWTLVGRSNVGKSSLINRLLGRRGLARTSRTPGRTRAVHYYLINDRYYLVDLPGYGYARASASDRAEWARLVMAYLDARGGALHAIVLIDAKIPPTPLDQQAVELISGLGGRVTIAATKIDRISRSQRRSALQQIKERLSLSDEVPVVPVSALSGEGIAELWRSLEGQVEGQTAESTGGGRRRSGSRESR